MDLDELKKLIRLVEKSQIGEVEIEEEGRKVRISKLGLSMPAAQQAGAVPALQAVPPGAHPHHEATHIRPPVQTENGEGRYQLVKSPMVGTFYAAPAEDAEPFVKVGDSVAKGQTLCIIEAMKLMNEIESDIGGRITEVLAKNGSPVEYGEVLFKIDPLG